MLLSYVRPYIYYIIIIYINIKVIKALISLIYKRKDFKKTLIRFK